MNTSEYLDRIGYSGKIEVSLKMLKNIHEHHLFNVPFENLDIQLGSPITLDP